jgi:dienelactone hydrolase
VVAARLIDPLDGILARAAAQRPTLELPRTGREWEQWRPRALEALRDALGAWPERVPPNPEVGAPEDAGDHWRRRVVYDADAFTSVPAWLLLPKGLAPGERRPALLCAHGHGRGKDDLAGVVEPGLPEDERRRLETRIEEHRLDYARRFARAGYVCLAPDWRGFGERRAPTAWCGPDPTRWESDPCDVLYMAYGYFGFELLTLNLWDAMRGLDYLQSRPEVDPARIGCVGLSFGGTVTAFLAALDERVRAADVVCYLSSVRHDALGRRGRGNFCGSQFLRRLLTFGDISTVAGLIAPRPLLAEIGELDTCFVVDDALRAYAEVERIYGAAGAADRLQKDVFPGAHVFSGRRAFDFFDRWLGQPTDR